MPQTPRPSLLPSVDDFVKYSVFDEGGLALNMFAFLAGVHGGMQLCSMPNGAAGLRYCKFNGHGTEEHRIPATLTAVPKTGEWTLLQKDDAVRVMIAVVRLGGAPAYSFMWTQIEKPVYREAVLWAGPLMGHLPWSLTQVFRVGRSDLWAAASVMVLQLVARVPNASRLYALCEHAFGSGGWELDLATSRALLRWRQEWEIQCVRCPERTARLFVCGVPLFLAQRDMALLALYLLTQERELAESIPQLRRPLAISQIR